MGCRIDGDGMSAPSVLRGTRAVCASIAPSVCGRGSQGHTHNIGRRSDDVDQTPRPQTKTVGHTDGYRSGDNEVHTMARGTSSAAADRSAVSKPDAMVPGDEICCIEQARACAAESFHTVGGAAAVFMV